MREIPYLELDTRRFGPYGWALGDPQAEIDPTTLFRSPSSDFWRTQLFDTGSGGETEVLWVIYRSTVPEVTSLEAHRLTQQALIPLTGSVVQIVATSAPDGSPDLSTLTAFRVPQGRGICMRPGCWHATRAIDAEVQCAMLTRRSTTQDLVRHLTQHAPATESQIVSLPARTWRADQALT